MSARKTSYLSRCLVTIRHWLKNTWISRVALNWRTWLLPRRKETSSGPKPTYRPEILALEPRWLPNDVFSPLLTLAGGFLTPTGALFDTWLGDHHLAPRDVSEAGTAVTPSEFFEFEPSRSPVE